MKQTIITPNLSEYPLCLHEYLTDCDVYDSSCSADARVLFAKKGEGYYIKSAKKGTLEKEAILTDYFNQKGLAAELLAYVSNEKDFTVTKAVKGNDCTHKLYLDDPKRLCRVLAECMRELHSRDTADCPAANRMDTYKETVFENYNKGMFAPLVFTKREMTMTKDEAFKYFWDNRAAFDSNTLIHGDFCLPNVMLDSWKFSAFIDLGNSGTADKHIDIFWCIWSLWFNLKTDEYTNYFLDTYGREDIDTDKLFLVECAEAFG